MKVFILILLLGSPLLAAMGTYTNLGTATAGGLTYKYGSMVSGSDVKIYFEIVGSATVLNTDPTTGCLWVGVPASGTDKDWKGADVGLFDYTPGTLVKTKDVSCKSTSTANSFCDFVGFTAAAPTATPPVVGTVEAGQNWDVASTTAADNSAYSATTYTLKVEIKRPVNGADATVDLNWDATKKINVYFKPGAACPTADGVGSTASVPAEVTWVAPPAAGGSGSSSFSALTSLSWIALILAFLSLN